MRINWIYHTTVTGGLNSIAPLRTQTKQERHARNLSANESAGFTLIELLVVTAIIGVLIHLLIPAGQSRLSSVSSGGASEQSGPPDILIDASLGDTQIVLERRIRRAGTNQLKYLVIKVEGGRVSSFTSSQPIDLRAMLEGADALQGSLPYALAWLAGNTDPLGAVRALGYNLEVVKEHERPCTDQLPIQACVNLGRQLATLIDATLSFGSAEEQAQFRRDASAIGIAPTCPPQEP